MLLFPYLSVYDLILFMFFFLPPSNWFSLLNKQKNDFNLKEQENCACRATPCRKGKPETIMDEVTDR
jgi:hypothetical protein